MAKNETESAFKDLQAEKFSQGALNEYSQYESPWLSEIAEWHSKKLIELIEPKSSVLDIGCGIGDLFEDLSKRTEHVFGCDISSRSLQVANRTNPLAFLILSDAENLPIRDMSFDAIILKGALHHFPNISKSLEEISRVLVRDGSLIISEPCGDTRFVRIMRNIFSKDKEKYFQTEELARMVAPNFSVYRYERMFYFSFAVGFIFRKQLARLRTPAKLWGALSRMTLAIDRVFYLPFLRNHNLGIFMMARKRSA